MSDRPLRQAGGVGGEWLGTLVMVTAAAVRYGTPVPSSNELVYLTVLRKTAQPQYLPGDWTFGSGFLEHAVFNAVFGPMVDLVGIQVLGWTGRILSWLIIARLVVALGSRLGAPWWGSAAAGVVWIGINQSMGVGGEAVFSFFEAKAVAWPLFLGALVLSLDRRPLGAAALCGLTFAFHPAIGLWAGGALLMAMLADPVMRMTAHRWIPLAAVAALPGLVPQVVSVMQSSMDAATAEFVALSRIPHHVDPLAFPAAGVALFALMLTFNGVWLWSGRGRDHARLLGVFQVVLLVVALMGVGARLLGAYGFLLLQPFRVLPVLVPILFMLAAVSWLGATTSPISQVRGQWKGPFSSRVAVASAVMAVVGVLVFANPVYRLAGDLKHDVESWLADESDLEVALSWLADNTPVDAEVVSPPWVSAAHHLSQRPQFVSWRAVPYDRPHEWERRLSMTVADPTVWNPDRRDDEALLGAYAAVGLEEWVALRDRYGVAYVVTPADYDITPAYRAGDWRVYALGPTPGVLTTSTSEGQPGMPEAMGLPPGRTPE